MPLARTRSTARRSTVSVFRPRKSNFTSPACSTHFMLNWVTGIADLRVAVERHELLSGRSPMTTPAAWVEAWRCRPSSFSAMVDMRATGGSSASAGLQPRLVGDRLPEADRIGRVLRHELGSLSTWP